MESRVCVSDFFSLTPLYVEFSMQANIPGQVEISSSSPGAISPLRENPRLIQAGRDLWRPPSPLLSPLTHDHCVQVGFEHLQMFRDSAPSPCWPSTEQRRAMSFSWRENLCCLCLQAEREGGEAGE